MSAVMCACESEKKLETLHICTTEQTFWRYVQEDSIVNCQNNYELLIDASKSNSKLMDLELVLMNLDGLRYLN